jgi:hypothetical protein
MKLKSFTLVALSTVMLTAACAGRAPAPVAVVQPIDETMSCEAIQAEVNANTQRIAELGTEQGAKVAQNVVAGVAGAFFILPLFLMDFQNAAGKDEAALKSRNDYLATLARQRCAPQPAAQPARAARS